MTDEEYLKAKGWLVTALNDTGKQGPDGKVREWVPIAAAVAAQLAEDRACYNFVRERSEMEGGMLVKPETRSWSPGHCVHCLAKLPGHLPTCAVVHYAKEDGITPEALYERDYGTPEKIAAAVALHPRRRV